MTHPGRFQTAERIEWEVSGESYLYASAPSAHGICIHCVDRWHHSVICGGITSERPPSRSISKRAEPRQEKSYEAARRAVCLWWLFVQRVRLLWIDKLDVQQSRRSTPAPGNRPVLFGKETENKAHLAAFASSEGLSCLPQDDKRARRPRRYLHRSRQVLIHDFLRWSKSSVDQGSLLLGPPMGRCNEVAVNQKALRIEVRPATESAGNG